MKTEKEIEEARQKLDDLFGEEELHEDLKPWIYQDGPDGWTMLKHPLVFQVPYTEQLNKQSNLIYAQKKEACERYRAEGKYESFVFMHERPYRMDAMHKVAHLMDEDDYWRLVGNIWTDTENSWQNWEDWESIFRVAGPNERQWLMTEDEQKAFDALPDQLTVYRGFDVFRRGLVEIEDDDRQLHSFSWTLDRQKAEWFGKRFQRDGSKVYVATAVVSKGDVVAHFLGRNEAEIVVHPDDLRITVLEEL